MRSLSRQECGDRARFGGSVGGLRGGAGLQLILRSIVPPGERPADDQSVQSDAQHRPSMQAMAPRPPAIDEQGGLAGTGIEDDPSAHLSIDQAVNGGDAWIPDHQVTGWRGAHQQPLPVSQREAPLRSIGGVDQGHRRLGAAIGLEEQPLFVGIRQEGHGWRRPPGVEPEQGAADANPALHVHLHDPRGSGLGLQPLAGADIHQSPPLGVPEEHGMSAAHRRRGKHEITSR